MGKYDWNIHLVHDTHGARVKELCDDMCDAHTHGLDKYGSLELQFVLAYQPEVIGYILNTVGEMVKDGLVLHDGDLIPGLCDDDSALKVYKTSDAFGKPIFRLIMPDRDMKYPEESEEYPYYMQYSSPYLKDIQENLC